MLHAKTVVSIELESQTQRSCRYIAVNSLLGPIITNIGLRPLLQDRVRVKQKNGRWHTHNVYIEEGLEPHVMNKHGVKNSQNCGNSFR